ncbi:MAG: hypothetical protein U5M53_08200 [Rhodoferax sp.]|nr:hypothetical protein [Rhodoferax sp.]
MNRCIRTLGLLAVLATAFTPLAHAQVASTSTTVLSDGNGNTAAVRNFPLKVQRGTLLVTAPPEVMLDGKPDRLSPGARIRGTNNMLAMSSVLVGQPLVVNYLREPNGLLHDVWILTALEAEIKPVTAP